MIRETKKIKIGNYNYILVKYGDSERLNFPTPCYRKNYRWALKKIERIEKNNGI